MRALQIIPVPEQASFATGRAAKYLGVSPNTLRKKADLGLILARRDENGHRVFLLEDLEAYRKSLPPYEPGDTPLRDRPVKTGRKKKGGSK